MPCAVAQDAGDRFRVAVMAGLVPAVIPGRRQRVRAKRGPMTGSASDPKSRCICRARVWIPGSRAATAPRNDRRKNYRLNFLYFSRCGMIEFLPQPAHLVGLVVLEVALEPFDVAVALEGEDVGGDAVEEPAVVADDHGAAGEILQRLLERAQRLDVEVVGRLVEQQQVGARAQHLGEMHAVALAARQAGRPSSAGRRP